MRRRPALASALLLVSLIGCVWLAAGLGSLQGHIAFDPAWPSAVIGRDAGVQRDILVFWRGPRVAAAALAGFALAVAGLLLQGITRNPLADPYLLGVSGGAGLLVVVLHSLVPRAVLLPWWTVPLVAFLGAMLAMGAVLMLARGSGGRLSVLGLILSGVVINALCAALMAFLLARFDPLQLRITSSWLAGGIGFSGWPPLIVIALAMMLIWLVLRAVAHQLNAFGLGPQAAVIVGVDAERLARRCAMLASLLAAIGVSLAGLLGYVGLIVPHGVRLLVGNDFRVTLPVSALGGALLVLVADTAARLLFAPEELPVGVLTALLGCPVLLVQLRAQLRGQR